jgi:hypothetical protein
MAQGDGTSKRSAKAKANLVLQRQAHNFRAALCSKSGSNEHEHHHAGSTNAASATTGRFGQVWGTQSRAPSTTQQLLARAHDSCSRRREQSSKQKQRSEDFANVAWRSNRGIRRACKSEHTMALRLGSDSSSWMRARAASCNESKWTLMQVHNANGTSLTPPNERGTTIKGSAAK